MGRGFAKPIMFTVVLPDHLHAIWTLPDGDQDFPDRWRMIKSSFSRGLARSEPVSASRKAKRERGVWQRRWDRSAAQNHLCAQGSGS